MARIPDRPILWMTAALVMAGVVCAAGPARAEGVTVAAKLILASNEPSRPDPQLNREEGRFRRVFGFSNYSQVGGGSAFIQLPGRATLSLGHGSILDVATDAAGGGRIRATVRWMRGPDTLLNTTLVVSRGVPVTLGGVPYSRGTLMISLVVD